MIVIIDVCMNKMEHAIFINNLKDLKLIDKNKFKILYFGTEFCEKLIPKKEEINKIKEFCKKNNIKLILVTPYCTNFGLKEINKIIKILPKKTEIIFNDWGVLRIIKKSKHIPILGRLLIRIRRDPYINRENPNINLFRYSNLDNKDFQKFLLNNNITRVEIDNVKQGYSFNLNNNIKTSLYYPFVYISSGRKCIFANCDNIDNKDIVKLNGCNFECKKYTALSEEPYKIIWKGNTHFYINNKTPKSYSKWNIDRLVYIPKIPF